MAYATVDDLRARLVRDLSEDEAAVAATLLDDAAVMIDAQASNAASDAKKVVSCRMVLRVLDSGGGGNVPLGATQGSQSALGYSQSWTIGSGGGAGEMYLSKADRRLLGLGDAIGSYSPVQTLVPETQEESPGVTP